MTPTLTPEEEAAFEESYHDLWWYADNAPIKILDKETTELTTFEPNWAQRYVWARKQALIDAGELVRIALPKPRQMGMTTAFAAEKFHIAATQMRREIYFLIHDLVPAAKLYTRIETMRKHVRPELRPKILRYETGRSLTFETESSIMIESVRKMGVGRAETLHHVHCTELPSWDDAETVLTGIEESVPMLPGGKTSIVLESTCEGVGNHWWQIIQDAKRGRGMYHLVFIPWWLEPAYKWPVNPRSEALSAEEEQIAKRIAAEAPSYGVTLTPQLIREKLEWRRLKLAARKADKFRQEYPMDVDEAFVGTGRPVFQAKSTSWHRNRVSASDERVIRDPMAYLEVVPVGSKLTADGPREVWTWREVDAEASTPGMFKMWEPPVAGAQYVLGGDAASGEARDYSAIQVLKLTRRGLGVKQVGVWWGHIGAKQLAKVMKVLAIKYNNGLMAPERNGPGLTVVETLVDEIRWPGMRLYQYVHRDQESNKTETRFGFSTQGHNRPALIEEMFNALGTEDIVIHDSETMTEIEQFHWNKKGKAIAPEGGFDDLLMAFMIGLYVRHSARRHRVNPTVARGAKYEHEKPKIPLAVKMHGKAASGGAGSVAGDPLVL